MKKNIERHPEWPGMILAVIVQLIFGAITISNHNGEIPWWLDIFNGVIIPILVGAFLLAKAPSADFKVCREWWEKFTGYFALLTAIEYGCLRLVTFLTQGKYVAVIMIALTIGGLIIFGFVQYYHKR